MRAPCERAGSASARRVAWLALGAAVAGCARPAEPPRPAMPAAPPEEDGRDPPAWLTSLDEGSLTARSTPFTASGHPPGGRDAVLSANAAALEAAASAAGHPPTYPPGALFVLDEREGDETLRFAMRRTDRGWEFALTATSDPWRGVQAASLCAECHAGAPSGVFGARRLTEAASPSASGPPPTSGSAAD